MRLLFTTAFVTLGFTVASMQPQDWSQWRGANRDGIISGFTPPASWPERPAQVWKVPAGIGHASPVVSSGRVFLFSRVGEQEALTAYDAGTGKQLWRQSYDAPYQMNPAATSHGKGPKATPVVHRGRVYTLGISGTLSAFDAGTGAVAWRHDFSKEFKTTSPDYGAAMSPMIDGDNLIAHVGGGGGGAIRAFALADGKPRWSWSGDGPAYASPVIATFGGVRHLVTQTQSHVVGVAPDNGRELWRIRFTTDYDQNIITPVVRDGLLIYSGLNKPATAVRLNQQGGAWKPEQVWQNPDVPMYMSSPVAVGGVLYGMTHRNRGQFFALDVRSGQTLWTSPGRQGDNSALAAVGGVVIAVTTDGEIVVMRQGRSAFELIREYTVADSPIWAHPAFAGRGVLVKDSETLAFWTF